MLTLLTLNIFYSRFQCSYSWFWVRICLLERISFCKTISNIVKILNLRFHFWPIIANRLFLLFQLTLCFRFQRILIYPADVYLLKVNIGNTRLLCEIYSKFIFLFVLLTLDGFHTLFTQVFPLLTLNKWIPGVFWTEADLGLLQHPRWSALG